MDARAIALAVPFFFSLIGLELLVLRLQHKRGYYGFADAIASLACGVGQQALAVLFVDGLKIGAYTLVWAHLRVATIDPSPLAWVVLLFAVDLGYWTYHWASHRVNFFWATHAVHHQSEEYNLSTALRQSWFSGLTAWLFYVPIAVAGFPPAMFVVMTTVNTLYQFWIHTRTIGTLGPLEWVLNTPSHHRVHHGTNPRYLDKNYAGIFIVWDRLFRTFAPETGEPVYGTVKPLASWNASWANVEPFARLWEMSRRTRRLRDKLWVWLAPPEWRPEDLGGVVTPPEVSREAQVKFATPLSARLASHVAAQFVVVVALLSATLWLGEAVPAWVRAALVAWILVGLTTWGLLLEGKRGAAVAAELARLAAAPVVVATAAPALAPAYATALLAGAAAAAAASALHLLWALRASAAPAGGGTPFPSDESGSTQAAR